MNIPVRRKRTKEEIVAEILASAAEGVTKSQIMYEALLNYNILDKYLNYLSEKALIKCIDGRIYKITNKGHRYLELFNEVQEIKNKLSIKHSLLTEFLR